MIALFRPEFVKEIRKARGKGKFIKVKDLADEFHVK